MRITSKARKRTLYHGVKCDHITIDCKVECGHCWGDETCERCNGHKWIWGSTEYQGYGFTPYTLQAINF